MSPTPANTHPGHVPSPPVTSHRIQSRPTSPGHVSPPPVTSQLSWSHCTSDSHVTADVGHVTQLGWPEVIWSHSHSLSDHVAAWPESGHRSLSGHVAADPASRPAALGDVTAHRVTSQRIQSRPTSSTVTSHLNRSRHSLSSHVTSHPGSRLTLQPHPLQPPRPRCSLQPLCDVRITQLPLERLRLCFLSASPR